MKKFSLILLLFILDITILFVYTALTNYFLGWTHGGALIPQIILWSTIVLSNRYIYRKLYKHKKADIEQAKEMKAMTDSMPTSKMVDHDEQEYTSNENESPKSNGKSGCFIIIGLIILAIILYIMNQK